MRTSCLMLLLILGLATSGCQSSGDKPEDPKPKPAPADKPEDKPADKPSDDNRPPLDLTGTWVRSDGVEFNVIDAVATLNLTRRLTESEDYLEYYKVDLERKGDTLVGTARFRYTDDPEELTLAWKLEKVEPYLYEGQFESYGEDEAGNEVRRMVPKSFRVLPKNPLEVDDKTPAQKQREALKARFEANVAAFLGKDEAASKAATSELLKMEPEAGPLFEKRIYAMSEANDRMRLALVMAMRGNPQGLITLQEISADASSLGMSTALVLDTYYKLGVCAILPIEGVDRALPNREKVLLDPIGAEASAMIKAYDDAAPPLLAVDWLKSEKEKHRRIAQRLLFTGGTVLNGTYGDYPGAVFNATDEQAQRDAAADDFVKWFDVNVRPKLVK